MLISLKLICLNSLCHTVGNSSGWTFNLYKHFREYRWHHGGIRPPLCLFPAHPPAQQHPSIEKKCFWGICVLQYHTPRGPGESRPPIHLISIQNSTTAVDPKVAREFILAPLSCDPRNPGAATKANSMEVPQNINTM